jgi:hypothetical protein
MRDAGIDFMVADQNMSILEGSIGVLPRRVLVADDEADQARRILIDAGIADELNNVLTPSWTRAEAGDGLHHGRLPSRPVLSRPAGPQGPPRRHRRAAACRRRPRRFFRTLGRSRRRRWGGRPRRRRALPASRNRSGRERAGNASLRPRHAGPAAKRPSPPLRGAGGRCSTGWRCAARGGPGRRCLRLRHPQPALQSRQRPALPRCPAPPGPHDGRRALIGDWLATAASIREARRRRRHHRPPAIAGRGPLGPVPDFRRHRDQAHPAARRQTRDPLRRAGKARRQRGAFNPAAARAAPRRCSGSAWSMD